MVIWLTPLLPQLSTGFMYDPYKDSINRYVSHELALFKKTFDKSDKNLNKEML